MPVFKRYRGKRVARSHPDFDKGCWVAEGMVNGIRYKQALRPELIKTEKQAKAEDERIRTAFLSGEAVYLFDKTKLHDFIDSTYIPHAKLNNKNFYTKQIEINHVKEFFPNLELKQITVGWIQKFQNHLKTKIKHCQKCANYPSTIPRLSPIPLSPIPLSHEHKPLSPSTVNRITRTLSAILHLAVTHSKLKENPVRKVKELKEAEPLTEFLTDEQKIKLFDALGKYPQLRDITLIALLTGWRQGQILSLRSSDLDKENKLVSLTASKQQKARKRPVSDLCWNLLSRLAAETPCDWLFYSEQTNHRLTKLPKQWRLVCQSAGLGNFRFHSLRRTAATDIRAAGVDLLTIQQVLGHQRIDTSSHYALLQDKSVRESLDKTAQNYEKFIN